MLLLGVLFASTPREAAAACAGIASERARREADRSAHSAALTAAAAREAALRAASDNAAAAAVQEAYYAIGIDENLHYKDANPRFDAENSPDLGIEVAGAKRPPPGFLRPLFLFRTGGRPPHCCASAGLEGARLLGRGG